ncbi:MAG TPA: putative glycolipid-binding domain-containing protein [Herpetosiphonaceae bacterium]|nr:putative glycolipid-binding domain-containing protein [Herpetosiphonaceae bacterium]
MQQDVVWMGIDEPRIEHLHLHAAGSRIIADGLVVGLAESQPLRLSYVLHCNQHYQVEMAAIRLLTPPSHTVTLHRRGDGQWTDEQGSLLAQLSRCIDVDIAVTPFTNTLPIRRLSLATGTAAAIEVAYVEVPSLALRAAPQRYSCLRQTPQGGIYRFESIDTGFTADVEVDAAGLVVRYPGLFQRQWPSPGERRADESAQAAEEQHPR